MSFFKELYNRNPLLVKLGTAHIFIAIALSIYSPFNPYQVLGLNSMIKPIKFAISISIMSYSLAWFLYYLNEKRKVNIYTYVTIIAMLFEQFAITFQALRGEQSHFNNSNTFGIILFASMGVFILAFTFWTAYITILFFQQKNFDIHSTYLLGIKIGLTLFVIFSLFGGYIAQQPGHTVGSNDGNEGIMFINWSKFFGDLRVAHFFGIHSLQIIPMLAYLLSKIFPTTLSKNILLVVSLAYTIFILFTMFEALFGKPFLNMF